MAQRPERDTTTPGFTVPDATPDGLALPEVALPVEVRHPARAVAPGFGPQAKGARPDRLAGRGQRSGKGRNYQFRRS
ncbi:hypothetical protein O7623_11610 [Solwaraspora sp. WMMD791]|uniref:hypothetical protein n=1 Tax=Solwaraspora sp. WMMD791 TaxID=3016086 RepID=UPI00249B6EEA|nr:hypothetical protein [Solwaraspora sp. WMMD791]WFE29785.1 hypothetical protein O7623_11610 [Solwaraspora sp. WMMD791]